MCAILGQQKVKGNVQCNEDISDTRFKGDICHYSELCCANACVVDHIMVEDI